MVAGRVIRLMPSDGEFDTSRVSVKTYVPAYQKEAWADHAEALGMSQSEFVRTMVQAGRRSFQVTEEPPSDRSNPRGDGLEERVLEVLDDDGPLSFDDLVASLTDDVEERLESTIGSLQEQNSVRHSPRKGYALSEDPR